MIKKPKPWLLNDVPDELKNLVHQWASIQHLKLGEVITNLILQEHKKTTQRSIVRKLFSKAH